MTSAPVAPEGTSRELILEVEDLTIRIPHAYGEQAVVSNVNFEVYEGENLGIVGESGCGKTLTGLAIMGLLPRGVVASGAVRWKGRDVLALTANERRQLMGREIAMVYQDPLLSLNPAMTVASQMRQVLSLDGEVTDANVHELLALVHIPNPESIARSYPYQLSGGQRQRVLIGLALAREPAILIGDEPTTALDETVQAQIVELLRSLQSNLHFTTVLITHNIALVGDLCQRIMVMYAGQLVETGPTAELIHRPRHPYATALVDSIKSLEARDRPARTVEGVVPSPLDFSAGCRFVERCVNAGEPCAKEAPALEPIGSDHSLACYFPMPEPVARQPQKEDE